MKVIALDWSGAKGRLTGLWIAEADGAGLSRLEPLPSREQAEREILKACEKDRDTVIGLDFCFSMPAWFIGKCRASSIDEFWSVVERRGEQWLAACEPPFWGKPGKKHPGPGKPQYRRTEREVGELVGRSPKSVFQVGGAGAVGTGSIRGMPVLRRLRAAGIRIWPFDSGTGPTALEIYPRIFCGKANVSDPEVRRALFLKAWPAAPASFIRKIVESADAFDAAISALGMARHAQRLAGLPAARDPTGRLEGAIWIPADETQDAPDIRRPGTARIDVLAFTMAHYDGALALWRRSEGLGLSAADERVPMAAYLARNPGMSFIALDAKRIVGTILAGHDGRRGLIHHLVVEREFRGAGIGRRLVERALRALKSEGIDKAHLLVMADNEAGKAFWRKVGAKERVELALFSVEMGSRPAPG